MKLKYFVLAACLSVTAATTALAARTENVTIVKKNSILENSSEHNRIGHDYVLTGQLVGFAVYPIPASGVNFGMYLDRNSLVQVEYSKGVLPLFFFNLKASTLGANYKRFFGNSFYGKIGADYRSLSISDIELSYTGRTDTVGEAESLVGNLAIGNQWQWENFTLGCDWIGFNPVISKMKTSYRVSSSMKEKDRRDLEDSWNALASVNNWQLFRFYLGASF